LSGSRMLYSTCSHDHAVMVVEVVLAEEASTPTELVLAVHARVPYLAILARRGHDGVCGGGPWSYAMERARVSLMLGVPARESTHMSPRAGWKGDLIFFTKSLNKCRNKLEFNLSSSQYLNKLSLPMCTNNLC
jgi:hypothetical protein